MPIGKPFQVGDLVTQRSSRNTSTAVYRPAVVCRVVGDETLVVQGGDVVHLSGVHMRVKVEDVVRRESAPAPPKLVFDHITGLTRETEEVRYRCRRDANLTGDARLGPIRAVPATQRDMGFIEYGATEEKVVVNSAGQFFLGQPIRSPGHVDRNPFISASSEIVKNPCHEIDLPKRYRKVGEMTTVSDLKVGDLFVIVSYDLKVADDGTVSEKKPVFPVAIREKVSDEQHAIRGFLDGRHLDGIGKLRPNTGRSVYEIEEMDVELDAARARFPVGSAFRYKDEVGKHFVRCVERESLVKKSPKICIRHRPGTGARSAPYLDQVEPVEEVLS